MQPSPFVSSELYGRQLARRILPILVTCCLIYWLEGGIPPTSWTQLVQVCAHLNTLSGNGLLLLALLIVQALCVGLAWGFLIWLMTREMQALRSKNVASSNIPGPNPHQAAGGFPLVQSGRPAMAPLSTPPSAMLWQNAQAGVPVPSQALPQYYQAEAFPQILPQPYQAEAFPQVLPQPYQAGVPSQALPQTFGIQISQEAQSFYGRRGGDPALLGNSSTSLENPFEQDDREATQIKQQPGMPGSKVTRVLNKKQPALQPENQSNKLTNPFDELGERNEGYLSYTTESPGQSSLPLHLPMLPRASAQSSPIPTPFDTQDSGELEPLEPKSPQANEINYPDMLNTIGFIPTRPQAPKEVSDNPFESTETGADMVANEPAMKGAEEANEEEEEDDPFIFGNPFEGPLPDVFHHDHDLRKSIMEQTGEVIELPAEYTRPPKKRPKKKNKQNQPSTQEQSIQDQTLQEQPLQDQPLKE